MKFLFFFFNDTATTEIYTLSLHDALPICQVAPWVYQRISETFVLDPEMRARLSALNPKASARMADRSEEHTSELQSRQYLVCRLLLEKKKTCNAYILVESIKQDVAQSANI